MTVTAVTSGQSIGTSTNIGPDKFLTKTSAAATTTAFVISPRITLTTANSTMSSLRVYYSSSSYDLATAGNAALLALRQTARWVDIEFPRTNELVAVKDSTLEPLTGPYIFVWCDVPKLESGVAASLTINLVELP